jgi:methionyl-tRNA formyltransferase
MLMGTDSVGVAIERAIFLGSKRLGLRVLKGLLEITPSVQWTIVHPNDQDDARSVSSAFNELAHEYDADISMCHSASAARSVIVGAKPDIGFVCGWYWLLDSPTLESVNGGLWGVHNSLLPKYRGGAPLVWSIINGDDVVGSTVFRISPGMDDGPVLHQVRVSLHQEETVADALNAIEEKLIAELPAKWAALLRGTAVVQAQYEVSATYCGQRTEEDGAIDWQANASAVHNFIRAQAPPYPGAFSHWREDRIIILRSRVFRGTYFGVPGQVLRRTENAVIVACGQNTAIEILNVCVNGRERIASEAITSIRDRFSPNHPR